MFHKFLPKTLWGQLISLLMLALLVSQVVTLAVFVDNRRSLSEGIAEEQMISQIANSLNLFEQNYDGVRISDDLLQAASRKSLRFKPMGSDFKRVDDHPEYTEPLRAKILARLHNKLTDISIISQGAKDQLFDSDNVPENLIFLIFYPSKFGLMIEMERQTISYDWMWPLLMTMGLMMLFIIIIISWVVTKITKPLSALAMAAQDLGLGRDVDELAEIGAEDIRKVTRSFNDMNQKIKRFVNDRTKLLAAISHDLRTPITALLFRTEFIEDKEMQSKFFETLEDMRVMTEATLSFSNDSHANEKTKNIDLKSLLDSLVSDYVDMGKAVSLLFNSHNQQVILPIRVQSIRRALRNFIDNGLKYGKQVEIEFKVDDSKNIAKIYIRDAGEGIDPQEFEQVFEPFYRIEKSRNIDTGGVGLGLSISRGIIRGHGGDVMLNNLQVDDEIIGLEVKVILPLK